MRRAPARSLRQLLAWPAFLQSGLAFDVFFAPFVAAEVEEQLAAAAAAAESAPLESGVVLSEDVELVAGRQSGVSYVEAQFSPAQVGGPVLCGRSVTEFDVVDFDAEVLDERRMRVTWFSVAGPAPARARITFILGEG